jgi:hypothetical protein
VQVEYVAELISLSAEMIRRNDQINQRLVNAIIVLAIAFSLCFTITVVGISYLYFTTDYNYGINQTQINTDHSNQTLKGGN